MKPPKKLKPGDEVHFDVDIKKRIFVKKGSKEEKAYRLIIGETFTTSEKGNSMVPLIHSGDEHTLEPCTWEQTKVGDIVYCKVNGRFYTHLVKAKNDKRGCQIGNNRGGINGWTKQVFGKVKR